MKLKMILLTLFAAGLFASIAMAKQPPGKGKDAQTTGATTTTAAPGKVLVCHKVAHGKYVLLNVSSKSVHARLKKTRDVLAGAGGTCPGPIQGDTGTTTTTTTTAATTTTTP
jgi:hypothetical protein